MEEGLTGHSRKDGVDGTAKERESWTCTQKRVVKLSLNVEMGSYPILREDVPLWSHVGVSFSTTSPV